MADAGEVTDEVVTVRRSRSAMGMTMPPMKARLRGHRCRYTEVTGFW